MKGFFASSSIQKTAPASLLPKCGACGLFKHCRSPKMPVAGKGRRGVLIVGDCPNESEDEEGKPFVGKAGQYLHDALDEVGVDLDEDCWSTNALICRPSNNKTPDDLQIDYCRPNLAATIAYTRPRIVLALGRSALLSVLQPYWLAIGPLTRWTRWQIPLRNHWICPTDHPAYLLRMNNELLNKMFLADLENAFALKGYPKANNDVMVEKLYDDEAIAAALDTFEDSEWVAFDYETNCLKPEYPGGKIYCAGVSDGKRTISYPWVGKAIKRTGEFLLSKGPRKIASNLKFEERWTRQTFGHGVRRWGWDTMLGAHVIDSREGITSLKFQALVKLGVPAYNTAIEPYLSSGKNRLNRIGEIAMPDLLNYNGADCVLEYRLAMVQRKEMQYQD